MGYSRRSKVVGLFKHAKERKTNKYYIDGGRRKKSISTKRPMFSIVTITRNNGESIQRCIDSVKKQSYTSFEHIIIDGCSSDNTLEVLQEPLFEVDYFLSEEDLGIYNAINKGLTFCLGNYILLIHADDFLKHDALEHCANTIQKSKCEVALGDSIYINDQNKFIAYKPARQYGEETILRGIAGPHEAAFISAKTYDFIGGYDESYKIAADLKFFRNCILHNVSFSKIYRVINYKLIGGSSFDKELEYKENRLLFNEMYPGVSDDLYKELYTLKNHKKMCEKDFLNLYSLLSKNSYMPASFYRILSKALIKKNLGDTPEQSKHNEQKLLTQKILLPATKKTVLLCIGKIKGISGGAERVLIELANHLSQADYDVRIICADGKPGYPFYQLDCGIDFIDINEAPLVDILMQGSIDKLAEELFSIIMKSPEEFLTLANAPKEIRSGCQGWEDLLQRLKNNNLNNLVVERESLINEIKPWLKQYAGNILRWRQLLRIIDPPVVIPFMISCIPQVFLANRGLKTRLILSNHNNPLRDYFDQDEWNSLGLDRLMRLFSVSSSSKSLWLLPNYISLMPPTCRKNAVVIENPIATPTVYNPYNSNRQKTLLAVGRYTNVKNFQLLIHVFSIAAPDIIGWQLKIFGDGPEKTNLKKLINHYGLEGQVHLLPPTPLIGQEYNKASLFLSSSKVEGFPLTLCEAMSYGLPAIGRISCSGVKHLIQPDINGYLIPNKNEIDNYAKKICELVHAPEKRQELSTGARNSTKPYSPEIVYRKWKNVINSELNHTNLFQ